MFEMTFLQVGRLSYNLQTLSDNFFLFLLDLYYITVSYPFFFILSGLFRSYRRQRLSRELSDMFEMSFLQVQYLQSIQFRSI